MPFFAIRKRPFFPIPVNCFLIPVMIFPNSAIRKE